MILHGQNSASRSDHRRAENPRRPGCPTEEVGGFPLRCPREDKILALNDYSMSPLFSARERTALEYADAMTITGRDVSDELFARIQAQFDDDAVVELTEVVAWENASAKFNRALRIPSQKLWKRGSS